MPNREKLNISLSVPLQEYRDSGLIAYYRLDGKYYMLTTM